MGMPTATKEAFRAVWKQAPASFQARIFNRQVAPQIRWWLRYLSRYHADPEGFKRNRSLMHASAKQMGLLQIAYARRSGQVNVSEFEAPSAGDIPLRIQKIEPANKDPANDRVILYLHGGAFVIGSLYTHLPITLTLAELSNATVYTLDYRLAPEYRHPSQIEDVATIYRWMLEEKMMIPGSFALAGESAGGNLVVNSVVNAIKEKLPLPTSVVGFSPWLDLTMSGNSAKENAATDPMIPIESCHVAARLYAEGEEERALPTVSPVFMSPEDLRGFPPAMLQVGSTEVLVDDSRRMAELLEKAGSHVELQVWNQVCHAWQIFHPWIPEASASLKEAAAFIDRHMEPDDD